MVTDLGFTTKTIPSFPLFRIPYKSSVEESVNTFELNFPVQTEGSRRFSFLSFFESSRHWKAVSKSVMKERYHYCLRPIQFLKIKKDCEGLVKSSTTVFVEYKRLRVLVKSLIRTLRRMVKS